MFFYSKVWFCLAPQEGNPSILVFDVITLFELQSYKESGVMAFSKV